jgi:hypothetical protein
MKENIIQVDGKMNFLRAAEVIQILSVNRAFAYWLR